VFAVLEKASLGLCGDACDGVSGVVLKSMIEFVSAGAKAFLSERSQ